MDSKFAVIGVGSPIVDSLARVDDAFLAAHVRGAKGGMEMIGSEEMAALCAQLPTGAVTRAPGGAAANTVRGAGRLGARAAVVGKLGNDDNAAYYLEVMKRSGVDVSRFKHSAAAPNARCLSLVTPDAQRTMRTDLAAAAMLTPEEISAADFAGAEYVYIEVYLLFNTELAEKVFACARAAGCKICLNFGSFEVVRALLPQMREWVGKYVDLVFANTEEAREFTGLKDARAEELALELASGCELAAVTDGADGACVADKHGVTRVAALAPTALVDTTGAGDFWAAGFLHGLASGARAAAAARVGAVLSREIIAVIGVELPENTWESVRAEVRALLAADAAGAGK